MPDGQRALLLVLAVVVVLVAVLVIPALTEQGNEADGGGRATVTKTVTTGGTATTGGTETTAAKPPKRRRPTTRTIAVRGGKPSGGVEKLSYRKGQAVDFLVTSNTADEVHVHGYDVYKDVAAGGKARVRFKADIEGIFEIEMHGSAQQIASLRVNPD